jgi:hypothetical protein
VGHTSIDLSWAKMSTRCEAVTESSRTDADAGRSADAVAPMPHSCDATL